MLRALPPVVRDAQLPLDRLARRPLDRVGPPHDRASRHDARHGGDVPPARRRTDTSRRRVPLLPLPLLHHLAARYAHRYGAALDALGGRRRVSRPGGVNAPAGGRGGERPTGTCAPHGARPAAENGARFTKDSVAGDGAIEARFRSVVRLGGVG